MPAWKRYREYERSCQGKRKYDREIDAQRNAKKSSEITGQDWSAYRCQFGNHFHIGHTPRSVRSRKEQKRRWRQRQSESKRNGRDQ